MGLDFSRLRFDARKDFLGVLMQQGRVQLDSDWNDWVAELSRRIQAGTLDTLGPATVPRETPDGFLIDATGGALTIGAGRMYVDGLLAENHGAPPADEWNPRLAEVTSTDPVDYTAQPYLPNPPELPTSAGPHLVYLDVWQREVGHLHDESLIESAVGVDSTGRLQTVWQVKVLADVGDVTCATDDADIPNWSETIRPSGARLSTSTGSLPEPPDPCQVPPGAGYLGLENQLYRIEIHTPGPAGTATFKWSRDNATVATRVTHINAAGDQVTVESIGKDDVLRFNDGDWIEVTDDWRELHNLPGELRRIELAGGVDDATRTIELESPLTAGLFPVDPQNATDPQRHTLIRRWDQGGQVREEDGTAYTDLNAAGSTGEILVPPAGTRVFVEDGILVDFDLDPAGGEFRSGDYWVVAARAVDASIDELDRAAPLGIHHHYARLAVVTFPDDETDCRTLWPPLTAGEGCDCTVCVSPEGHNSGTATIQQAIDAVKNVGGTVCLGAGTYHIARPIQIDGALSLRVRGQGWATILRADVAGTVVDISGGSGIALENLSVIGGGAPGDRTVMVSAANVVDFRLEHCNVIGVAARGATTVAVGLAGAMLGVAVTDCAFVAEEGIASGSEREKYLLTAHLRVGDNVLFCRRRGLVFDRVSLHLGDGRLSGNMILGCADTAIVATGGAIAGSFVTVSGNAVHTQGTGIRTGTDDLTIRDNVITGQDAERSGGDGIVVTRGLDPVGIDRLQVIGNRLLNIGGHGLVFEHRVDSGMIKQNMVDGAGGAGLIVEQGGNLGDVSIENNQFMNLGAGENPDVAFAGLQIVAAESVDLVGNLVEGVGREAVANPLVAGIAVGAVRDLRVSGNRLHAIGPDASAGLVAGVYVAPPVPQAALDDNTVRRGLADRGEQPIVAWAAIVVSPVSGTEGLRGDAGFDPARLGIGSFKFVHTVDSTFLLSSTHILAVGRRPTELSVRGNQLMARNTRVPLVVVGGGVRTCLFSENHCRVAGERAHEPIHGSLDAFVNNVANNRLIAETDGDSLHLFNEGKRAIVLGNITTGPIQVDGGPVLPPFDQLNIRMP